MQYVWSPVYVDAMVLRDGDSDGDGTLDERLGVVQDANYNVTALFDNAGNVVERYVYDPFGQATVLDAEWNVRSGGSAYDWLYLHQGGRYDVTSGLYHFRFRDYSPTLGRWTSLDPLSYAAGDVNLYRTVGNDPLNSLDPSGLAGDDPLTQGPYGIIGRLALWWYSKGDEHKLIPRNFDPNQPMPGLRIGDGIDRDNKMWYDRTLNAAPKVLMVAGFVLLGMVVPGPEDVFIGWAVSRGYTVVKSGTQFIIKIKGENRVLSETEVRRLIVQYREWVGKVRELEVAKLSAGKVTPHLVRKTQWGSVQIDVEVPGKAYISVGGPAKAEDLAELGRHLQKLKAAADEKRVRAIMYLEEGTPEVVINLAKKWLGKENVIKFQVNYRDYYGVVP